jgi:ABC-type antimicrobial peptide transport system permease subunit
VVAVLSFAGSLLRRKDFIPISYNLRSLLARKSTTLVTGAGLALVVFVLATVLMLEHGVRHTLVDSGSSRNVKILRSGTSSEVMSAIPVEQARIACSLAGLADDGAGGSLCSPELSVVVFATRRGGSNQGANLMIRGVDSAAFKVHEGVSIEGRSFRPGTAELVVGKRVAQRFVGYALGQTAHFARRDWTVVGILDAQGSAFDSEVWGDLDQIQGAFERRGAVSSVTARLAPGAEAATLQRTIEADAQLNQVKAMRELDYFAAQSKGLSQLIDKIGLTISALFAIAAILGAMITMYAQVAARTRELGTLRALGFRRRAVLLSLVLESSLLGLCAGAIGIGAAWLMQSWSFSTLNARSFSEVTFALHLSPDIVGIGIAAGLLMGYLGGIVPAMRAASLPMLAATRD